MKAIEEAIHIVGSQSDLAEECGVVQSAVSGWVRRGAVPAEYCAVIERATQGAVTRKDLRPDDWQRIWPELASQPAAPAADVDIRAAGREGV